MKYDSLLWKLPLGVLLSLACYGAVQVGKYGPGWCDRILAREAERTRTATKEALADNLRPVLREVKAWRKDTKEEIGLLRTALLDPGSGLSAEVLARADSISDKLDSQLTGLRQQLEPTLTHVEA